MLHMESDYNICDNMYDGLHVRVSVYIKLCLSIITGITS